MSRKAKLLIVSLVLCAVVLADEEPKKNLLRDGFALVGVDGKIVARGQTWLFEFDSAVSDGITSVRAGTRVQILPSAGLEKILAHFKDHPEASYRLYNATVTRYEGQNYLFVDYFLPLIDAKQTATKGTEDSEKESVAITINEPNDVVTIPQEIVEKLRSRRAIRPEKLTSELKLQQDSILARRTGFIDQRSDGRFVFVFDALGRNVAKVSVQLLPCQQLERALRKQAAEPERLRFRVSGIVTSYQGSYYLLLQQAIRVYSYGNFGR